MLGVQPFQKELKEEIIKEALKPFEDCDEDALKKIEEKYEKSILATYVDEKDSYIVNGAIIRCDQMSDKDINIRYEEGKIIIWGRRTC